MKKLLVAIAASMVAACSGGSANDLLGGAPRTNHPIGDGTSTDTSSTDPASDPGADGTAEPGATDAGADGATSAEAGGGADGSAPDGGTVTPPNAFTGAGAYTATTGPSTLKGEHPNGGNPAKVDCLSSGCHGAGGQGPRFAAGGTIYTSAAATTPAAKVEVRLRDAAGNAASAYTDANGNFFFRAAAAANLTFPVNVGARDGTTTRTMSATTTTGACSSAGCHGSAATSVVHVP